MIFLLDDGSMVFFPGIGAAFWLNWLILLQ